VVQGEGNKFQVYATGEVFDGLNAVKRQQKIYQVLNPHIASGAIHAVSMRLQTVAERAAQR
jgi:acid stress-induced BolA-like protein IbaG/YrbA